MNNLVDIGRPVDVPTTDGYLKPIVDEAEEHLREQDDLTPAHVAHDIAHQQTHLWGTHSGEGTFDNLLVLRDLRDADALCVDEIDSYANPLGDYHEGVIEGIVRRSLEEYIHDRLSERVSNTEQ